MTYYIGVGSHPVFTHSVRWLCRATRKDGGRSVPGPIVQQISDRVIWALKRRGKRRPGREREAVRTLTDCVPGICNELWYSDCLNPTLLFTQCFMNWCERQSPARPNWFFLHILKKHVDFRIILMCAYSSLYCKQPYSTAFCFIYNTWILRTLGILIRESVMRFLLLFFYNALIPAVRYTLSQMKGVIPMYTC